MYSLYPNPATEMLHIQNQGLNIDAINIIDINGILIYTTPFKTSINISNLEKGTYILQVQTKNGISNKLFIKE